MKEIPADLSKLYPFKNAEDNYLSVEGGRMHFLDEGSGEPVVMLHGNPTWSFYYRNLVLGLREHFRCIVPDHIGCGLSDKPQQYPYTLEQHIENIFSLVEHLKLGKFHLVVHDWGGAIGMGLAVKKCITRVKSLVVLNSAAFLSDQIPTRIAVCRTPVVGDILLRGLNVFVRGLLSMGTTRGLSLETKEGYLFPYGNWHDRVAISRFVKDIPLSTDHPSYQTLLEIEEGLQHLQLKPMMIGWGMQDFCFTSHFLEKWIESFPKAKVQKFPTAGHLVLEDAREELIPSIRNFLLSI